MKERWPALVIVRTSNHQRCAIVLLRRVILQQLLHRLIQVLLILLLVLARVQRLGRLAGPNQLFGSRVVHIKDESPVADCRTGRASHSAKPRTAHAVSIPLLFLVDGSLITDIQIRLVVICLRQPFCGQLGIDGSLDLRIRYLIGVRTSLIGTHLYV